MVAGRFDAADAFRACRPDAVVSIVEPGGDAPGFPCALRLVLAFDDVEGPSDGGTAPDGAHVGEAIRLARSLPPGATVLVHCEAGLSRSPAVAAVMVCAVSGRGAAQDFIRDGGPWMPNPLVLDLGDALLATGGAMADAGRRAASAVRWTGANPF